MLINFSGYRLSNKQKASLTEALQLTADAMISKRLSNTLEINVAVVKDLIEKEGVHGDVDYDDYESWAPKTFDLRINYSDAALFDQTIITTIHEMVHVAQYATRRLRHTMIPCEVVFEKQRYNTNLVAYDDRPWETEAHMLQEDFFKKFVAAC